MMFLAWKSALLAGERSALVVAGALFAAGMVLGTFIAPHSAITAAPPPTSEYPAPRPAESLRAAYPAEVLRVFDGDTFEARVRIWPGQDVTTKVRLRGVDAPEMKAQCEDERTKALAAKDLLARMLNDGGVGITNVKLDKYGGRGDADVSTRKVADVGRALTDAGLARAYTGGHREGWCGAAR